MGIATIPLETFYEELEKLSIETTNKFCNNILIPYNHRLNEEPYTASDIRNLNIAKSNTLDKLRPRKLWSVTRSRV